MRASTSTGDVAASLAPPTRLHGRAVEDLSAAIRAMLADTFALFMKTKNFHWHMSGPHFRDWHLLLDEQADQIYAVIDPLAERVRKIGGLALRSVGDIQQHQRILDNDEDHVDPHQMLVELRDDHRDFVQRLRELHELATEHGDVATASLVEDFIDQGEQRHWFLLETTRQA